MSAPRRRGPKSAITEESRQQYEDAFSHPLRLAYYLLYPIGFTAEWLIMRPFHYIVSRPYLNRVFGYTPIGEEGHVRPHGRAHVSAPGAAAAVRRGRPIAIG